MKQLTFILIACTFFLTCKTSVNSDLQQKSIQEIRQTEKEFELMAENKGIAEAFYYFANENAVIQSGDTILKGRDKIKNHYKNWKYREVSLKWDPDFIEVSSSSDLGYTYGRYSFKAKDTTGKIYDNKGYFHTVWKKQSDGNWRYVWD